MTTEGSLFCSCVRLTLPTQSADGDNDNKGTKKRGGEGGWKQKNRLSLSPDAKGEEMDKGNRGIYIAQEYEFSDPKDAKGRGRRRCIF